MPASDTFCPSSEATAWDKLLRQIKLLDLLAVLVPVTQFMEIKLVGRLFMPDVLLACLFPMLFFEKGRRLRARLPMIFILFAFFWLFGQIATDMVRGTGIHDYARGWAKIAFTLVNFCALYLLLYGHQRRLLLYAFGLAAGGWISYFVNPSLYAMDYPWKFGYGVPTTWVLILLATAVVSNRRSGPYIASGIFAVTASLNIYMGFRSFGGICFLAACFLFVQARWGKRLANIRSRPRHALLIGLLVAVAGVGVLQMYDYTARSGMLGEDALKKYEVQAAGEYGLFLGGRSELLVSGRAILDSPLLGHGSWAKNDQYSSLLIELKRQAGYVVGLNAADDDGLIPTHSHLLGAWVEAGFLGAIFWAWVICLPIRVLLRPHGAMNCLTPLVAFVAFLLVWDILFSPYGATLRFMTPYYVVVMMTYLTIYQEKKSAEISQ